MCGIFGYIGFSNQGAEYVLEGLRKLEYRGYDSWGIASQTKNSIKILKEVGRIPLEVKLPQTSLAIGHTRWATHGGVTKENAHPHHAHPIAVVHNGIIENYVELQNKYSIKKLSETDSEVLAHIIAIYYNKLNDLRLAVSQTLNEVVGTFGLVVMHEDLNEIVVARRGSPLVIGVGEREYFVASDVPALLKHTRNVIYLNDNEYATLNAGVKVYSLDSDKEINYETKKITWDITRAEKEGYDHFMLKEIHEQPRAIMDTLQGRIMDNNAYLPELEGLDLEKLERIIILACGTSWHAGLVGEFLLEGLAKIPVEVEYASEFRYRQIIIPKNTLVIAISQSGETADTLAALKEAKRKGAKVLSICNVVDSTIPRESDFTLYTRAGPEIGVASTKAFMTQIIIFYLLTAKLIELRKTLSQEKVKELLLDLMVLPEQLKFVLEDDKQIKKIAEKYKNSTNALFLGRGIQFPIALEGALKLKEVSYIHAEGYPAAEMKHGPIALIDKKMPVVVIATKDEFTYEKVLGNIQEVKARNGQVLAIATQGSKRIKNLADDVIEIPFTRYSLSSLLAVVPLQLLSYYVALLRGCDVDKPRNLAKSVTVE